MGELVHPSHEEFVLSVSRQMSELVHAAAEGKILSLVAVREILWRLNSLKEIERDPDMLFLVGIDSDSDSFPSVRNANIGRPILFKSAMKLRAATKAKYAIKRFHHLSG